MLTPAIACQHDILLGDKGDLLYRMTVRPADRRTVELTSGEKKRERQSYLSLAPCVFDRSSDGVCNKSRFEYFKKRASMTFDVQSLMEIK